MENLGKENFWNEMKERYPKAVDVFCKWIDGYMNHAEEHMNLLMEDIEFYDLPYEMQMGIMNMFFIETYAGEEEYVRNCQSRYKEEMVKSLNQLNDRLNPTTGLN